MVIDLEETGVHDFQGGEVDGLALAPFVDDGGEHVAAFAVGLIVKVKDVGPYKLSARASTPVYCLRE